jgi:hypothetical protein
MQCYNDPNSLTSLIFATSFLALALLEDMCQGGDVR